MLVALARLVWRPLLILLVAGGLAAWILGYRLPRSPVVVSPIELPQIDEDARRWTPRAQSQPAPGCRPRAERRCIQGDAWWIDGCGNPHDKADECENRRCDAGVCEPLDPADCGGVPMLGRCEGDVASTCEAGRPVDIDCGADGRRCVMTEDGPMCRDRTDDDCEWPPGSARCEEHVLVACVEGRLARHDCRIHGGTCEERSGGRAPRCVVRGPIRGQPECGACGCEPEIGDEVCDGRDNDRDGWVDEDGGCDPVDIIAFVIEGDGGESSWANVDIDEEIDRLNAAFAREDDLAIEFRLAQVVAVSRSEWMVLDNEKIDAIVRSGAVHPAAPAFFIPIVFTEEILVEDVPRPGIATVPNGVCGGIRRTRDPQSPIGVVAIAKRHWPTTLAHEIGHFLGLCHTHAEPTDGVERIASDDEGEGDPCGRACDIDEDGLCDTPPDPGPSVCRIDEACAIDCGEAPPADPANIMAYYPPCRTLFTPEQARLMRTTVWLRRAWHPCVLGDGCPCDPLRPSCPEAMTCRQFTADDGSPAWGCGLEGASVPGAPCKGALDCSRNSVCVIVEDLDEGRCIRPCDELTPDCDCRPVDPFPLPMCIDDALPAATHE